MDRLMQTVANLLPLKQNAPKGTSAGKPPTHEFVAKQYIAIVLNEGDPEGQIMTYPSLLKDIHNRTSAIVLFCDDAIVAWNHREEKWEAIVREEDLHNGKYCYKDEDLAWKDAQRIRMPWEPR